MPTLPVMLFMVKLLSIHLKMQWLARCLLLAAAGACWRPSSSCLAASWLGQQEPAFSSMAGDGFILMELQDLVGAMSAEQPPLRSGFELAWGGLGGGNPECCRADFVRLHCAAQ
jgi:hypothetical protein